MERGYQVDFFCGLFLEQWNEMMRLSRATLRRIAALGAELPLDIYIGAETDTD